MAGKPGNPKIREVSKKTQFVSGDPRQNKKGRPHLLPNLTEILAEELGETKSGKTATQRIIAKVKDMAMKGNLRAGELLIERGYGRVIQGMDIKTDQPAIAPVINVYTGAAPPIAEAEDKVDDTKQY